MVSLASSVVTAFITLRGSKKRNLSAAATLDEVHKLQVRPEPYAPSKRLDRTVSVTAGQVNGWPVYHVAPRGGAAAKRALYLHGGSWYHQISPFHWKLIATLAKATNTTFLVPIYPLVPIGTAATVVPIATEIAAQSIAEVGAENMTIMGDSAGGSIALAVAQQLRDRGADPHRATILISPALDLSFTDPRIAEIQPSDPWLAVPGPSAVARLWAGELAITDPLVSPLFGDLDGLAPITLFTGTRDVTNADAHALRRRAAGTDVKFYLHEAEAMIHVYPLLPIPEGRRAREVIRSILAG
jgi:acetyl esterase/lipase